MISKECHLLIMNRERNPLTICLINWQIKFFLQKSINNINCRIFYRIIPVFSSCKIIQKMNSWMSVFHSAIYNFLTNRHVHKIIQFHWTFQFFHGSIFKITVNQFVTLIGCIKWFKDRKYALCIIASKHYLLKYSSFKGCCFKTKSLASFPDFQQSCCLSLKMLHQIDKRIFIAFFTDKCRISQRKGCFILFSLIALCSKWCQTQNLCRTHNIASIKLNSKESIFHHSYFHIVIHQCLSEFCRNIRIVNLAKPSCQVPLILMILIIDKHLFYGFHLHPPCKIIIKYNSLQYWKSLLFYILFHFARFHKKNLSIG